MLITKLATQNMKCDMNDRAMSMALFSLKMDSGLVTKDVLIHLVIHICEIESRL